MFTSTAMSTTSSGAPPLSQAQPSWSPQQAPVIQETIQQVPLQTAGIEVIYICCGKLYSQIADDIQLYLQIADVIQFH